MMSMTKKGGSPIPVLLLSIFLITSCCGVQGSNNTDHSTADPDMVSPANNRSVLVPDSAMDEADIDAHEMHVIASNDAHINDSIRKMYLDPQLASKKISLQMKNAEIKDVIAMIGKAIGINFIVDADIKGKIASVDLKDYDASHALQFVCKQIKPEALLVKLGDIWHVMPKEEGRKALLDALNKDYVYAVLPIHHSNVDQQFQDKLKDTWKSIARDDLTGAINVDEDQKRIHVRGKRGYITEFQQYLKEVDKPILQVRIDVIIVLASKDFLYEFGFDWSGIYNRQQTIQAQNTPFGFYGLGGTELDYPAPTQKVPNPPNTHNPNLFVNPLDFAFNLFNSGASFFSQNLVDRVVPGLSRIPFVFGGPDLSLRRLNVILNMAETENKLSIIARPSILTSNNKIAKILIGQSIPLQTTTDDLSKVDTTNASTFRTVTTINYKDTGVILEVRPLVNPDKRSVYLNVLVEESIVESGSTRTNERGVMVNPPVISVIKTKNEVVLRNGQTTIIGGLSSKESNTVKRSVPFLSKFPIVGNLFKSTYDSSRERERYIFITPKIVEYEV